MKPPRNSRPPRPRSLAQRRLRLGLPPTVAVRTPPGTKKGISQPAATQTPSKLPPAPAIALPPAAIATPAPPAKPKAVRNGLLMRGDFWEVSYEGQSLIVEDCLGLHYIALLIQNAGAGRGPIHATELVALATGRPAPPIELEARTDILDETARRQLLTRLQEIASEREAACAREDFETAAGLDEEYERIASELTGSGNAAKGTRRGAFSDAGEKARKAVSKAITEAVARVRAHPELAALADFLSQSIRKGRWLSYSGPGNWDIDVHVPPPRK